jgi:sigma-54 specific flagellar transcriptional regulator A
MPDNAILLIESDASRVDEFQAVMAFTDGADVVCSAPSEWQAHLSNEPFLAVVIGPEHARDIGDEVLHTLHASNQGIPLVLMGEPESPFPDGSLGLLHYPLEFNQFMTVLHRIHAYHAGQHPHSTGTAELSRVLVGKSEAIRKVRHLIGQVADSEASVLILGESGTGKEVVAKSLHYLSSRREMPFVPVNCGAIPGDLLESELFGHEKGAFTGALTARQGRFEIAEGGTLFLDEIGDMPMPMQVKLLRVLQERSFERVGSNKTISADVRVIAATHRDLEDRISAEEFREDLYYRLNVFPIEMPALRERPDDVPLLVHELSARLERQGRDSVRLTAAALESLSRYPWPGNVRELANLVERLVIMHPRGIVDLGDLPSKYQMEGVEADSSIPLPEPVAMPIQEEASSQKVAANSAELPSEGVDLKEYLATLEQGLIEQALDAADGVVAQAAKLLNLRRTTLVEKMRKYDLQRAE